MEGPSAEKHLSPQEAPLKSARPILFEAILGHLEAMSRRVGHVFASQWQTSLPTPTAEGLRQRSATPGARGTRFSAAAGRSQAVWLP